VTDDPSSRIRDAFAATFGQPPHWIASAPGRVNLIGEFTDFNDGFVLPMAIGQRTLVAAAPNGGHEVVLRSASHAQAVTIDLSHPIEPEERGRWGNYPRGVLAQFRRSGYEPGGFDALIDSSVPAGAGLASSAALAAAMATLLEGLCAVKLDPVRKAQLCQRAEHDYAHVPCGIMDPYISILGRAEHVLLLDCRSNEPTWLPLLDPAVTLLVINTNVRHQLASGEYARRRQSCEAASRALAVGSLRDATPELLRAHAASMEATAMRCARHVIGENARTLRAAQCIRERAWLELGQLMDASHESLRTDFEVSCAELDSVVDIAHAIGPDGGVYGCRLTGGGFGGCAVALIASDARVPIMRTLSERYARRTGIEATLFTSRPAAGAALAGS